LAAAAPDIAAGAHGNAETEPIAASSRIADLRRRNGESLTRIEFVRN
jgi:hypothetical protein